MKINFDPALRLQREGFGNINYDIPGSGAPPPPFVPKASNGVFYDTGDTFLKWGTNGAIGTPFTADRFIDFAFHSMNYVRSKFIYDNPAPNTHEYHLGAQGVNIEQVFTQSATNLVPFERQVNFSPNGGPPDDNVYIQGWNIDSDFDATSPSWTWRLEYKYTGSFYENHLQFSDPIAGTIYRVLSFTLEDHGSYAADVISGFCTVNDFQFEDPISHVGFGYFGINYNNGADSVTLSENTQGGLQINYSVQNGTGLVITAVGLPTAVFLMDGFGNGIGFGPQSPGGLNCAALGNTLWVNNFFNCVGGQTYSFDNQTNDLFFTYLPHEHPNLPYWHNHWSTASGDWDFGVVNHGGFSIAFATFNDTWGGRAEIMRLNPAGVQMSMITTFVASVAGSASINIPDGATVTTPNEGDIWNDGTNLKMRIGGVTKTFTLV
jgi:hypothetical protein